MMVYNVTTKVSHDITEPWLQWLQQEHIPDMVRTGCFGHASVFRLLDADDEEGVTYVVQYHAEDIARYQEYITHHAGNMRKKSEEIWGDRVIAFRTIMQSVH
jgi:hypothetical protein